MFSNGGVSHTNKLPNLVLAAGVYACVGGAYMRPIDAIRIRRIPQIFKIVTLFILFRLFTLFTLVTKLSHFSYFSEFSHFSHLLQPASVAYIYAPAASTRFGSHIANQILLGIYIVENSHPVFHTKSTKKHMRIRATFSGSTSTKFSILYCRVERN